MKIIHIIPNLKKGGAERIVIDIIRTLSKKKELIVKLVLFEDKIEYDVEDIKHLIEIVPSKVSLSISKKHVLSVTQLQDTFDFFKPDIIHSHLFEAEIVSRSCHFPSANWFSHSHDRMRSLENIGIFSVKSKRDLTNYFEKRYLLRRYRKNGGNHFIAISEDIENFLKSVLPMDLSNVFFLQNAIDVQRFLKPNHFVTSKSSSICHLISIGRLDKNKNHQFLIEVVLELRNRNFPVHLSIIGEGTERRNLETQIERLKLENEVSLLGLQDKVEENLWNADLYVHSAITEGFGLTLIEAMASGLPVISLDGGGNRTIMSNEINGYLIESQDCKLFSAKIIELVENKELYHYISNYATEFAHQFDINHYIDKLIDIYQKSL